MLRICSKLSEEPFALRATQGEKHAVPQQRSQLSGLESTFYFSEAVRMLHVEGPSLCGALGLQGVALHL